MILHVPLIYHPPRSVTSRLRAASLSQGEWITLRFCTHTRKLYFWVMTTRWNTLQNVSFIGYFEREFNSIWHVAYAMLNGTSGHFRGTRPISTTKCQSPFATRVRDRGVREESLAKDFWCIFRTLEEIYSVELNFCWDVCVGKSIF